MAEKQQLIAENQQVTREKEQLITEKQQVTTEKGQLITEKEQLRQEFQTANTRADEYIQQLRQQVSDIIVTSLYKSHIGNVFHPISCQP